MKINFILGFAASCLVLGGCATGNHLKETGEAYGEGDILFGTAMIFVTPMVMLIDIFTLGGSLDAEQSTELWSGVATQYTNIENQNHQHQHQPTQQIQTQQIQTQPLSYQPHDQTSVNQQTTTKPASNSANDPYNLASNSPRQTSYRHATSCVYFQIAHGDLPNRIYNGCTFPVLVKWCDYKGCGAEWGYNGLKPGQSATISAIKGKYTYVACEYPGSPRTSTGSWSGTGEYYCR